MWIRILICLVVLLMCTGVAYASDAVLLWDASPSVIDGYRVYHNGTAVGDTAADALTFTHRDVNLSVLNCYTVTAFRGTLESAPSNQVCVDSLLPPINLRLN